MSTPKPSIHALPPIETGGVIARKGFSFQDHIAVHFCLEMLSNASLEQVWCETQDDITLIWQRDGLVCVEFVQAKSHELNQLWSVAELCKARSASILERSLAYDRCAEPCVFRIVTARPPNDDLTVLQEPFDWARGRITSEPLTTLKAAVREKLPHATSQNGNGTDFWVDRTIWECQHGKEHVCRGNLLAIQRLTEQAGEFLASDQLNEIHAKLLVRVKDAAEATWENNGDRKKLLRQSLRQWFVALIHSAAHPGIVNAGEHLHAKMATASLPADAIETAANLRRRYREEVLKPRYMESKDRHVVEGEVEAALLKLRSELDAQIVPDDGPAFHAQCLRTIAEVRSRLEAVDTLSSVPLDQFMLGFMYNLVDRCPHRFRRASA